MTFPHGDHEVLVVVTQPWISMIGPYQQASAAPLRGRVDTLPAAGPPLHFFRTLMPHARV
jgi:hypothetical protein